MFFFISRIHSFIITSCHGHSWACSAYKMLWVSKWAFYQVAVWRVASPVAVNCLDFEINKPKTNKISLNLQGTCIKVKISPKLIKDYQAMFYINGSIHVFEVVPLSVKSHIEADIWTNESLCYIKAVENCFLQVVAIFVVVRGLWVRGPGPDSRKDPITVKKWSDH